MKTIMQGSQSSVLLDAGVQEDRDEWIRLWSASRFRRPHDHPAFLESTCAPCQKAMAVACFLDGRLLSLYPFNVLDLAQFPFALPVGVFPGVDIISPYGYGGATFEGASDERQIAEELLMRSLSSLYAEMNVVSEFVREDLFAERLIPRHDGECLVQQQNVVVDLQIPMDQRWLKYEKSLRWAIRRAERAGLTIRIGDSVDFLEPFVRLYHETMKRDHAREYYFFSLERFRHLHESLQPYGQIQVLLVYLDEQVISAELLLTSGDTIYSFLSGTDSAYFGLRPADLLKHETIVWGRERGYRHFVIGGGLKADDGLFQFKRKFEPHGLVDFHVRRVVWDSEQYEVLVRARRDWEKEQGRIWQPEPSFFPAYRVDSMPEGFLETK